MRVFKCHEPWNLSAAVSTHAGIARTAAILALCWLVAGPFSAAHAAADKKEKGGLTAKTCSKDTAKTSTKDTKSPHGETSSHDKATTSRKDTSKDDTVSKDRVGGTSKGDIDAFGETTGDGPNGF